MAPLVDATEPYFTRCSAMVKHNFYKLQSSEKVGKSHGGTIRNLVSSSHEHGDGCWFKASVNNQFIWTSKCFFSVIESQAHVRLERGPNRMKARDSTVQD